MSQEEVSSAAERAEPGRQGVRHPLHLLARSPVSPEMSEGWQTSAGSGPDSRGEAATPSHPPPARFPTHCNHTAVFAQHSIILPKACMPVSRGILTTPLQGPNTGLVTPHALQQSPGSKGKTELTAGVPAGAASARLESEMSCGPRARRPLGKATRGSRLLTSVNVRKASPGEGAARVVLPMRM